jgi:hypothetical protein
MSEPTIVCAVCQQPFIAALTKCPNCEPQPKPDTIQTSILAHCEHHDSWEYDCIDCENAQASPRATVPPRIVIDLVPHQSQRYDTCGDYYMKKGYFMNTECTVLHITVSDTGDRREMLLVAIHELCEWAICQAKGITNEEIDKFDLNFEKLIRRANQHENVQEFGNNDPDALEELHSLGLDNFDTEPGDLPSAPYYHAHQIATGIECILAAEMGVDWLSYDQHIKDLSK